MNKISIEREERQRSEKPKKGENKGETINNRVDAAEPQKTTMAKQKRWSETKRRRRDVERETEDGFLYFYRRGGKRYSKQNVRKSNSRCDGLKTS